MTTQPHSGEPSWAGIYKTHISNSQPITGVPALCDCRYPPFPTTFTITHELWPFQHHSHQQIVGLFKIKCCIYCSIYVFNHLTHQIVLPVLLGSYLILKHASDKGFECWDRCLICPTSPVVSSAWFCIVWWFLGMHMSYYSKTGCNFSFHCSLLKSFFLPGQFTFFLPVWERIYSQPRFRPGLKSKTI